MSVETKDVGCFQIETVDEHLLEALRLEDDICLASYIKAYDELNK